MNDANWLLFAAASLAIVVTPGQDMILVMSKSLAHGTRAGIATAAGVSVGLVGHTMLATLGLEALLRASDLMFTGLKLVGAAYLLYLGLHLLRTRAAELRMTAATPHSHARLFATGAASNLSNPKIAVFYFAFLPQFVDVDATHPTRTIFVLGLAFAALTFVVKGQVAVFAGRLSSWFASRPSALAWLYRTSGAVMVGLAVRLALARREA